MTCSAALRAAQLDRLLLAASVLAMTAAAPVRVVLVGVAGYGQGLLAALDALPEGKADLVAIVDPAVDQDPRCDWAALRARPGLTLLTDLDQAWALDPELVILATPIHCHADQVCACLARNVDVLCEKPLAATLAEAERMRTAAAASSAWCAIGYQWSFSAAMAKLRGDRFAGRFGAPKRMRVYVSWPRPEAYYTRNRWAGRLHDDAGRPVFDSPMANAAAHFLHHGLELFGPEPGVAAVPDHLRAECYAFLPPVENADTCCLHASVGDAEILFLASHATGVKGAPLLVSEFEYATVIRTAKGGLRARLADGSLVDYGDLEDDPWAKVATAVAAVRSRESLPCSIDTALPHLITVASAQTALGRGHRVADVDLITDGETGARSWAVPDLNDELIAAFGLGKLPSDLGASWTVPAINAPVLDPAAAS